MIVNQFLFIFAISFANINQFMFYLQSCTTNLSLFLKESFFFSVTNHYLTYDFMNKKNKKKINILKETVNKYLKITHLTNRIESRHHQKYHYLL